MTTKMLIGLYVDDSFKNIYNESVYQGAAVRDTGHAMVLVGYDDKKYAFKVINSWGKTWAAKGFGWISYSLFNDKDITEAYYLDELPKPRLGAAGPGASLLDGATVESAQGRFLESPAVPSDVVEVEINATHVEGMGERSATLTTENHHCWYPWPLCKGEPTRHRYTLTLDAEPGTELRKPKLTCVTGEACRGWQEILFVRIEPDGRRAIATWDVWGTPATWRLAADVYRTPEVSRIFKLVTVGTELHVTTPMGDPAPELRLKGSDGQPLLLEAGRMTGLPNFEFVRREVAGEKVTYTYKVKVP